MRRAVCLAISSVVITLGVVMGSSPAFACSCAGPTTDREAFKAADVVFVGTVTEHIDEAPPFRDDSGQLVKLMGGPIKVRFDVVRALKGGGVDTIEVETSGDGASCGTSTNVGGTYLVFANVAPDGSLGMGLCGGTRSVENEGVPADLAAPEPILPGGILPRVPGAARDAVPLAALVAAVGAIGAAATAAWLWTRRRRSGGVG